MCCCVSFMMEAANPSYVDSHFAWTTIGKFLPNEWSTTSPDDITVTKVTGGLLNRVYLVTNSKVSGTNSSEPSKVILRLYDGGILRTVSKKKEDEEKDEELRKKFNDKIMANQNTEANKVLIFHEMSRQGWGPRLLGVFPGGSIEEYIERSHTLTPSEASDPVIRKSIAMNYARFASLGKYLPLPKNKLYHRMSIDLKWSKTFKEDMEMQSPEQKELYRQLYREVGVDWDACLTRIDYKKENEWINNIIVNTKFKEGLLHLDTNHLNILVKEDKNIMIIDYELSYIGPRGFDIGGHWINTTLKWNGKETKVSGHAFPSLEERREFVREYLAEVKRLDPTNFNSDGLDSEGASMREADIGTLSALLGGTLSILKASPSSMKAEPCYVTYAPHSQQLYLQHKKECLERYPEWSC